MGVLFAPYLDWGGRIRTPDTRIQSPLPYHLATPHHIELYHHRP